MTITHKISRATTLATLAVALAVGAPAVVGCAALQKIESSVVLATDTLEAVVAVLAVTDELAADYIDKLTDPTEAELADVLRLKEHVSSAYNYIRNGRMALMSGDVRTARLDVGSSLDELVSALAILDSKGVDVSKALTALTKARDLLDKLEVYCGGHSC